MGEILVLFAIERSFALYRSNPNFMNKQNSMNAALLIVNTALAKAGTTYKGEIEGPRRNQK
ncbi:hypothetical protein [Maridesulfovibrio bastinii]|uniref:hypothetical protein n=1 Tax=Maridesulfovibrio bastinii TaxID=47157 RepID=UPI00040AC9A6|nr:hypothetical protein [Maridesulfovibrio bastinii]